jgi:calcium/calmodulin-dependent protein kinase I
MAHFSFAQLKEDLKEIAHGHLPHHGAKVPNKFADNYDAAGKDLGSGAFSVVKLCTHRASGKQYAVKCCAKGKLKKEDLDGLYKETQLLREMDHPHIIKCYETFDEGSTFYIVTELVSGGDLFDRIIHKTTYTEKEARDLLRIFFQTMAYMHDTQRVVHRDLKPENILLTSKVRKGLFLWWAVAVQSSSPSTSLFVPGQADDADLKVADFGFAKRISDLTPKERCNLPLC